ncbi:ABC transporter ATP-binding protein [Eggerthellaceae bacterium zg-1084]|uniref:ATP-binding cassette domain-containing protein n=1 Tax=Berryella wangjianweii TaxID=2734634 RepID=UPI0015568CEA|nr:ABC transporter ATP-binding protein [Berryella wangjianweii]NPD31006.1 ABC transporter ATP-binding protein [Berryella wangjianweii]
MGQAVLEYEDVEVSYGGRPVVGPVSFALSEAQALGVVGASGSGKTTLACAALGLLAPGGCISAGDIRLRPQGCAAPVSLTQLRPAQLRALCGTSMGMVFQDALASLNPVRRIGSQAFEAVRAHERTSRAQVARRFAALLERLALSDPERVMAGYPAELSGGMGQRVGIALALLLRPRVLFADEPTASLDVIAQRAVADELARLSADEGVALVLITHNIALARHLCDEALVMSGGAVADQGPLAHVLSADRACPEARALLDAVPQLTGRKGR